MRLTYDPTANIAYIRFREAEVEIETLHISDELNVDIAPDGEVYGIELLNANAQLGGKGLPKVVFENALSGGVTEMKLPS